MMPSPACDGRLSDSTCLDTNTNPNFGYTSFDNFGAAAFCIFQMLTLDGWTTTLLYPLMDAMGPYVPLPYFLLLVLFGAFFAMQLLVAILSSKFAQLSAEVEGGSDGRGKGIDGGGERLGERKSVK